MSHKKSVKPDGASLSSRATASTSNVLAEAKGLNLKEPAVLRDQVADSIKKIKSWRSEDFPTMGSKWWNDLQRALDANGRSEALSKEAVDEYDHKVKEGLGILQILVLQQSPASANGQWLPVLRRGI